jgi:hypothetical protein
MLRTTEDVLRIRHWAEERGAVPCRDRSTGRIWLAMPDEPCEAELIGWDEFEVNFRHGRGVFVHDDAPGGRRFFVGPADEARRYMAADQIAHGGMAY